MFNPVKIKDRPEAQQWAYLGLIGFSGSGKTLQGLLIADALAEQAGPDTPVVMLDTETGAAKAELFMREACSDRPFDVKETRNFNELKSAIEAAERMGAVLVIDSQSHFHEDCKKKVIAAARKKYMNVSLWDPLRLKWQDEFVVPCLNAKTHIIVAGRAMWDMETVFDDHGNQNSVRHDARVRGDKDSSYDPDTVLELQRLDKRRHSGETPKIEWAATVKKDRYRRIEGKTFRFKPGSTQQIVRNVREAYGPWINVFKPGGADTKQRIGVEKTSAQYAIEKERKIIGEEIAGELERVYPGTGGKDKQGRSGLLFDAFGTRSNTAIMFDMPMDELRSGRDKLRELVDGLVAASSPEPPPETEPETPTEEPRAAAAS